MAEAPAGLEIVVAELALQEAAYAVEATDRAGRRNFAATIVIDCEETTL